MAHNITTRDGLFVVREPAWHGLGTVLEDYPTREQAKAIAHPWEPISEPVYRAVHGFRDSADPALDGMPYTRYEEIPEAKAIVRDDNDTVLGVVSDTYEPVSNETLYDIAEAIQGEDQTVRLETGGSLKGGKKVWLLLRLNEPVVLSGDSITATLCYYALQNNHDAAGAFRGQAISTRIVCDNTSQVADMEAGAAGTEFVFRHTVNVKDRIEEAKRALAGWREGVQQWRLQQEALLQARVERWQEKEFTEMFLPMPPPHTVSLRVEKNVIEARRQLDSIITGETLEGVHGTAYGLVQASVEYLNHARKAKSKETRFQRAYLDRDRIVTDAVKLVREVAHV
jgi:phage/plasmid-like protein (TIGR03299 family)